MEKLMYFFNKWSRLIAKKLYAKNNVDQIKIFFFIDLHVISMAPKNKEKGLFLHQFVCVCVCVCVGNQHYLVYSPRPDQVHCTLYFEWSGLDVAHWTKGFLHSETKFWSRHSTSPMGIGFGLRFTWGQD
jgi:hypothetical protein